MYVYRNQAVVIYGTSLERRVFEKLKEAWPKIEFIIEFPDKTTTLVPVGDLTWVDPVKEAS